MLNPYYEDATVTLYTGDATDTLVGLPDASIHCVVTSPPYWALRDYGTARWAGGDPRCRHSTGRASGVAQAENRSAAYLASAAHRGGQPERCRCCGARREDRQHGLEPTPEGYVARLRGVFAQLHRVLVDRGTVWLNLGDSYSAEPPGRTRDPMRTSTLSGATAAVPLRESVRSAGVQRTRMLPRKNLIGMPWRVAFALQQDGWIIRNCIIWHKPNAMPESVRDRLSNRYEMIFLLTKQQRYYFDLDPIRAPVARPEALGEDLVIGGSNKGRHAGIDATMRRRGHTVYGKYADPAPFPGKTPGEAMRPTGIRHNAGHLRGKNPGDVWSLPTRPLRDAHFAAFPIDIPLRCIAAGCPPGGIVLDPFSGAATTGLAAHQLGRSYVGIDLNPEFHAIGKRRILQQTRQRGLGLAPEQRDAAA
ncbi:DNA-methyltransferase [Prauserella oleivorans]|uniref:Methyltransferase n=1 Tax=Prauserella oleivorans TaxID=1478153 RepID=A0ABW5WEQ5_9PSEU